MTKILARRDLEKIVERAPLDVAVLSRDARLKGVDLKKADLDGDGKIEAGKEARALFAVLDKLDTDKSARSLQLIDGEGQPTPMQARVTALQEHAKVSPHRPGAPGAVPPVPEAVKAGRAHRVDPRQAFAGVDSNRPYADALLRSAMRTHGIRYTEGRDDLLTHTLSGRTELPAVFDTAVSLLEAKVKSGELSAARGEAILYGLYARLARDSGQGPKLLERFTASPLAADIKNRDTDRDGVRDAAELAQGTDPLENKRISDAGGRNTVTARREALEDVIHNPLRAAPKKGEGTHQTYVGDQGVSYGDKNGGYAYFTPKTITSKADGRTLTIPDRLDLGGRRVPVTSTTAHRFDGTQETALVVQRGKDRVVALPGPGTALRFYAPTETMTKDTITVDGKVYAPWTSGESQGQVDVAVGFQHAYAAANSGRARVSSAEHDVRTRQFNEARSGETMTLTRELDARTRGIIEGAQSSIAAANTRLETERSEFVGLYKDLAPLIAGGYLSVDLDEKTGKVDLRLQQGKLGRADFDKLVERFGPKIDAYQRTLSGSSERLATTIAAREAHAESYLRYASSSDFTSYLESLTPEARSGEMAKLATALTGTAAGQKLADQLQTATYSRTNAPAIVRMILDEPTPRTTATADNLAVVGQMAAASAAFLPDATRHGLYVQLVTGKAPTAEEKKVIEGMMKAQAQVAELKVPEAARPALLEAAMKKVFVQYPGPTSHLFHAYAHTMHHAAGAASHAGVHAADDVAHATVGAAGGHGASWGQRGLMIGAAGFSMVSFGISISHLMHAPTVGNVAHVGIEGLNTGVMLAGAAESFMAHGSSKAAFLSKVGKYGGPVVAAAHLVMDAVNYTSKNSPEGKEKAVNQIVGSALILGGAIFAASPVGWVAVAGGVLVKLVGGETDPRYEDAYGKLDGLAWK